MKAAKDTDETTKTDDSNVHGLNADKVQALKSFVAQDSQDDDDDKRRRISSRSVTSNRNANKAKQNGKPSSATNNVSINRTRSQHHRVNKNTTQINSGRMAENHDDDEHLRVSQDVMKEPRTVMTVPIRGTQQLMNHFFRD